MSKKIIFSKEARKKLSSGVCQLADAVISTLGPSGRNVIIQQEYGNPYSTKDGVTVAKSIELEDELENVGAQLVKQASIKTADQAGDGTTTATLLAQAIFLEGLEKVQGSNVRDIGRGLDFGTKKVVEFLKTYSKDVTEEKQLAQVASISANNDSDIGNLIASAINTVGRDGIVAIEESKSGETYLEIVEGIQFERGYKSPYFVTNNSTMQAVLQNAYILITDKRLNTVKELLPILERVSQENKPLLIIADDIDGETLSTLVLNKMRGIISCVAVKAPEFGDRKKAMLEDIAILTGGTVISEEKGLRLDTMDVDQLGKAEKIVVSRDTTTIVDAKGSEDAIIQRLEELKEQIEKTTSPFDKEVLQTRVAKFAGGVAIVHVGGHTELEMKERKDRVEDSLHATKAAIEEGILPGGGKALLRASKLVGELIEQHTEETEGFLIGLGIIKNACRAPFYQILINAGYGKDLIDLYILKSEEMKNDWVSFDPRIGKTVDMLEAGIVDPTKVVRLALENAVSVASTMLTTDVLVVHQKQQESKENNNNNPYSGMDF